jgi:hypothetical protein
MTHFFHIAHRNYMIASRRPSQRGGSGLGQESLGKVSGFGSLFLSLLTFSARSFLFCAF